jgi:transposase-like protein
MLRSRPYNRVRGGSDHFDFGASERPPAVLVNILGIIDDAKCYEMVRALRWPDGLRCVHCDSAQIVKQGRDETELQRQRYRCRDCGRHFDDLTGTIFVGHHQPSVKELRYYTFRTIIRNHLFCNHL